MKRTEQERKMNARACENIHVARVKKKLSQQELFDELTRRGITTDVVRISKLENGRAWLTAQELVAYSVILDMPYQEIFR